MLVDIYQWFIWRFFTKTKFYLAEICAIVAHTIDNDKYYCEYHSR